MKTKYVCLNCNSDIHKHLIDKQLESGLSLDSVKCPECGKEFVAPRGKTLKKWQMDHPKWQDKTFWFTTPKSVKVRNFRKMVIKGQLWNGMPLIERGDYVWQWGYNSIRKCWQWIPMVKTRAAFVREYTYRRGYTIGSWNFEIVAGRKNQNPQQINVSLDRKESWKDLDFTAVINEVKKYGFNVTEDFLTVQVKNIKNGFKQNRYLDDRSGQVFSPVRANGLQFRFFPMADDANEYVC